MSDFASPSRPAWQTDELFEEWIDEPEEDDLNDEEYNLSNRSQSISFTAPLATTIRTNHSAEDTHTSSSAAGTFLIRDDVPDAPFLPKTPGRQNKGMIKDFFTPLPLERMFEPPSPPPAGLGASEEPPCGESPESVNVPSGGSGLGSKLGCQFTFAISRNVSFNPPNAPGGQFIQAQSTPNPPTRPAVPMTDPRLRLFQFQYDTFTRDHLSAMVDSIAINSPSGQTFSSGGQSPLLQGLSRVTEDAAGVVEGDSLSRMRSAKRIKLSPRSDFHGEGAGADAMIARPKLQGRDYVGESRSLMEKIKQARDFSTISTTVSAQDSPAPAPTDSHTNDRGAHLGKPDSLEVPPNGSTSSTDTSVNSRSGTAYRQQAEALMAQIRGDVKGQKRLFSGDTDATVTARLDNSVDTTHTSVRPKSGKDDPRDSSLRIHRSNSSYSTSSSSRSRNSPRRVSNPRSRVVTVGRLTDDVLRMSLRDDHAGAPEVTITPPTIVSAPSEPILPSPRVPPSYPAFSIRSATNDDLNRFVSSSTASGTTMTSGTAPSFVKHSGPAQIRTIAPQDVPTLPDKVGKMIFDKVLMKWVKNPAFGASIGAEEDVAESPEVDGESEDPFRDIESLDDSRIRDHHDGHHTSRRHIDVDADDAMSKIEEVSEVDGEEAELTSFSFDDPTGGIVPVMTGVESGASDGGEYDESSDSDDDHEVVPVGIPGDEYDTEEDLRPAEESLAEAESDMRYSIESMAVVTVVVSPLRRPKPSPQASTPALRSVLKSTTATPVSALKDPSRHRTPAQRHRRRRSVSFSDGKRDGPIRGLCTTDDDSVGSNIVAYSTVNHNDHTRNDAPGFVPSARSKRIADLLQGLESDTGSDDNESPTKTSTSERPDEIQPLRSREPNSAAASSTMGDNGRREFSQTSKHALSPARLHRGTSGNATFLTECSFGVAHDRLVQVITDVQPFEPHWEELSHIDLSDKKIESVARLKEFLPHLDSLHLNSNQLSWLSGVPSSVRTLSVASNSLTALSSFGHLLNLENLDISKNDIDSLRQLSCLRHLRELRADANKIGSIDGLERMDGLVKLSLEGNIIRSVDLDQCRWTRLEMLNLSHNRLDNISGLASLPSLIALNVDNNLLSNLEFGSSMPRMRILRLSGNRIRELNVALTPNLRTLYADNNSLTSLVKVDRLTKLENLSLRNQSGRGLNLRTRDIRDVKRLYLSGNPLRSEFLEEPCYNLVYLELAACRLTALPAEMGRMVPNLRVLNLNYNFLEDVSGLGGLGRLRKLTVIGSRLRSTKPVVKMLQGMPDVEMLDFRMNPCTLGWYLPLLVKDVPGALQPSDRPSHSDSNTALAVASSSHQPQTTASSSSSSSSSREWHDLDTKFRRDLPDEAYIGRLAYRGLVMRVCPRVRMLDGVEVGEKERRKAGLVLKGLMASTSASASASASASGGAKGKQKEKETQRELGKEGKGKSS